MQENNPLNENNNTVGTTVINALGGSARPLQDTRAHSSNQRSRDFNRETLNTKQFARRFAKKQGVSIELSEKWVMAIAEELFQAVLDNDTVNLYPLGTFKRVYCPPRKARNIAENLPVVVPETMRIKWSPSVTLCNASKEIQITDQMRTMLSKHLRNKAKKQSEDER